MRTEGAWARQPASRDVTAAYLVLVNERDRPTRVVSAASSLAKTVELHEMSMEGAMMRMRQVTGIDLPPKSRVELKPGGLHLMVFGLTRPLAAGDCLPLVLTFADGTRLSVEADVRAPESAK